ncbi:glycoside hydrolase family 32 protein [Burkholderia pyrrocinia]|uniref:glycoside hydrolase family 32 protein n=1 Tax=Burkholderia pyrrocinia TaxID=60550 RepID=UPI00158A8D27|nr:glycoside hydrolase family 32 protein [Burkholderia pyrrocinia]
MRYQKIMRILRLLSACVIAMLAVATTACAAASEASREGGPDTPQWRSALHYTPQRNWMNDPNGLVYYQGLYHLFYQFNPNANVWGDMSWGHATSRDLLHWKEQPVAMRANPTEEFFSGSIVVDAHNTSGLGTACSAPLVALYTSVYKAASGHAPGTQAQSLAYSNDGGRTWRQYAHNPVLTLNPESKNFRDPKVSWYAPGGYWLMTTVVADAHVVKMYRSHNLIDWEFLSDFTLRNIPHHGTLWEMPDLFPLPLDGDSRRQKWVMIVNVNPWSIAGGSGVMYFVGHFDGHTFTPEHVAPAGSDPAEYQWLDNGADYYAAGTFANAPDGRAITIGWMSNWDYAAQIPTTPWRGAMALPRVLALKTINGMPRLTSAPVAQYASFVRGLAATHVKTLTVSSATRELAPATRGAVQNIDVTISPHSARRAGLIVRGSADGETGTRIFYDTANRTLTLDRSRSGDTQFSNAFSKQHVVNLPLENGKLHLTVLVDRNSVEVFTGEGHAVITDLIFPAPDDNRVSVFADNGDATFIDMTITRLAGPRGAEQ